MRAPAAMPGISSFSGIMPSARRFQKSPHFSLRRWELGRQFERHLEVPLPLAEASGGGLTRRAKMVGALLRQHRHRRSYRSDTDAEIAEKSSLADSPGRLREPPTAPRPEHQIGPEEMHSGIEVIEQPSADCSIVESVGCSNCGAAPRFGIRTANGCECRGRADALRPLSPTCERIEPLGGFVPEQR
jgi:hypothetical protein